MAAISEAIARRFQWPKFGGPGVFRRSWLPPRNTNPGNPSRYVGVASGEQRRRKTFIGVAQRRGSRNFSAPVDTGRLKVGGRKIENLRTRLRRLEKEAGFGGGWISPDSLKIFQTRKSKRSRSIFAFLTPMPEPLRVGMSKLEGLDRKSLLGMCEEERTISRIMRELKGRNEEEHGFYLRRGHCPE
jgi:hypothetical protein